MLTLAFVSTVVTSAIGDSTQLACSVADCLKRLASVAHVEAVSPPSVELFGTWSSGGGLAGSVLYVFEDQTYIHTEWADIMPEKVEHKGTWQVADGVLVLTPDSDVTWDRPRDLRFLMYRAKAAAPVRLLGLDRQLGILELSIREIRGHNDLALKAASFGRKRGWQRGESVRRKAEIMKRCWDPEYFASPK